MLRTPSKELGSGLSGVGSVVEVGVDVDVHGLVLVVYFGHLLVRVECAL